MNNANESLQCPRCPKGEGTYIRRLPRYGILEMTVLSWLGYFPWVCSACRRRVWIKSRGWSGVHGRSGLQQTTERLIPPSPSPADARLQEDHP